MEQVDSEEEKQSENFPQGEGILETVGISQQSQPTKVKVKAFKNRVFQLLIIYAVTSRKISPLLKALRQEIFSKQPEKLQQLAAVILKRQDLSIDDLTSIASHYKTELLFRSKKAETRQIATDFTLILKRLWRQNQEKAQQIVNEMVLAFSTKRNCKVNFDFFLFLMRQISSFRAPIAAQLQKIKINETLRPAQLKQIEKLLKKCSKK